MKLKLIEYLKGILKVLKVKKKGLVRRLTKWTSSSNSNALFLRDISTKDVYFSPPYEARWDNRKIVKYCNVYNV